MKALVALGARDVAVLAGGVPDGAETRVPVDRLAVGDLFVVRPGETIATDGVVEQGTSAVDASMLTGESVPVADRFEVHVPSLRTGATRLSDDAVAAGAAGGVAASSADRAAGGSAPGPLVQACTDLAERYRARTADVVAAAQGASAALSGNADRYLADDAAAQVRLDALTFDGPGR